MVDLVGVGYFTFLIYIHLRRKLPLENTPILAAKFSPTRFVSICQILVFNPQGDVRSSCLSDNNYKEWSTLGG